MGILINPYFFTYGPVWDFNADFTSATGLVEIDPTNIFQDEGNNRLDANIIRNTGSDALSKNVGTLSDSTFVLEFDIDIIELDNADTGNVVALIILSDEDANSDDDNLQDYIGMKWYLRNGDPTDRTIEMLGGNGVAPISGGILSTFTTLMSVSRRGVRVTRTSATTATIGLYDDATQNPFLVGDLIEEESNTVSSSIIGLDEFKILNQTGTLQTNNTHLYVNFIRAMLNSSTPPSWLKWLR